MIHCPRSVTPIWYKNLLPKIMHLKHSRGKTLNKNKLVGGFSVQDLGLQRALWGCTASWRAGAKPSGTESTSVSAEVHTPCKPTRNAGEIKTPFLPSPTTHRLQSHRTWRRSNARYQTAMEMHFLMPKLTKKIQINPFFSDMVSFILLSLQAHLPNHV